MTESFEMVEPATIGPVTFHEYDTFFTVGLAFILAVLFLMIHGYIQFFFSKKIEKFKKDLEKG